MKEKIESYKRISLNGIELKVFQIHGAPLLKANRRPPQDPAMLRAIHSHFTFEVFFICNGKLQIYTEDGFQIHYNSVVIIPPRIKHYSYSERQGNFCLLFSVEDSPRAPMLNHKISQGITSLPLTEELTFYLHRLKEKNNLATTAAKEDCQLLTALIFNQLVGVLLPEEERQPIYKAPSIEHIDAIESFINSHLRDKFTLSDVAKNVALSTKQITRIIEKEYGMTFSELVADKRLAPAKMLLKNSPLPVKEIAARTFPGSETYFYTLFKKKYGMSPLEYRKNRVL